MGWTLIAVASALTFAGLGFSGRPPGVDLPQHALFLQRMLDGGSEVYETRWVAPYVLLFLIAMPVAALTDPAQGIWTAAAFAIALLPVGSAALASSLRRSPALGLFAYLGAFSTVTAWGFASLILGAGVFGIAAAAAVRYGRKPGAVRGVLLAGAIVLSYAAHGVACVITVIACWLLVLVWPARFRVSQLWPLLVGTGISLLLASVWLIGMVQPSARSYLATASEQEHSALTRLLYLPLSVAQYGRAGTLFWLWALLAVLFVLAIAITARDFRRVVVRARRLRARCSALSIPERTRRSLKRHGILLAWIASVVAYFVIPLWVGTTLLVYPRAMIYGAILAPLALLGRRSRWIHRLGIVAIVPVLAMIHSATRETRAFAEHTECIDVLTQQVRPHERLLSLHFGTASPSYTARVDLHLAAEIAARRHGMIGKDFTDYGWGPVTYRAGYDRMIVPANVHRDARSYDHARHGREFTAWLLVGAPGNVQQLVRSTFGTDDALRTTVCDAYALVLDTSVVPRDVPGEVFLPHFHPEGSCSRAGHAAAL